MGQISRRSSALEHKIGFLQKTLKPFIQFPSGPIHPAFPGTVMAYHLLTEDELDSLAHFYHQSTPGPFTRCYPSTMNWDKDFLARTPTDSIRNNPLQQQQQQQPPKATASEHPSWLTDLLASVDERQHHLTLESQATAPTSPSYSTSSTSSSSSPFSPQTRLSKKQRLRIKRRKFGKFIGFGGMDTPTGEVFARIRASLDRAVERSRAEMRRNEEVMLGRRKGW